MPVPLRGGRQADSWAAPRRTGIRHQAVGGPWGGLRATTPCQGPTGSLDLAPPPAIARQWRAWYTILSQCTTRRLREVNRSNRIGKAGEELGLGQIALREGFTARITRTGRGSDCRAERWNPLTGRNEVRYYEIKAGKHARLSKLQRQTRSRMGAKKYRVHRVDLPFNIDLY